MISNQYCRNVNNSIKQIFVVVVKFLEAAVHSFDLLMAEPRDLGETKLKDRVSRDEKISKI